MFIKPIIYTFLGMKNSSSEYRSCILFFSPLLSFSILIIAFAVASIPEFFDVPEFLVAVFIALLAWIVGFKTSSENGRWHYRLGGFSLLLGKLVPSSYILCVGILIISLAFSFSPIVLIIFSSIAAFIHLMRMILVLKDNPF